MVNMERKSITSISEPQLADIRSCWPQVKEGIENILTQIPALTFIPEDVYSECVNENAFLFTSPTGFLVLTIEIDKYTKHKTLYIWLAYTYTKGNHEWLGHEGWFENTARSLGCKYIEAQSAIPEMEPYAIKRGWNVDARIFRRQVDE